MGLRVNPELRVYEKLGPPIKIEPTKRESVIKPAVPPPVPMVSSFWDA
jgi:hypothetical protein